MDIVVAYLLDRLLLNRGVEKQLRSWAGVLWLFNPYTATISTRGNGESVVLAMVYR